MIEKQSKERRWKKALLTALLVMGVIILYELQEFVSGFLGALTLYVLMRKQLFFLIDKKKLRPGFASLVLLLEVIFVFLTPTSLIFLMLIDKISTIQIDPLLLISNINDFLEVVTETIGVNLFSTDNLSFIPQWGVATVQSLALGAYSLAINSIVMALVLFFMFLRAREFENFLWDMLPFKKSNKQAIIAEASVMIRANALGIPLLAVVQGIVSFTGYWIFDVNQPLFYAMLTSFATVIPIFGTIVVWAPLGITMIVSGDLFHGVGLLLFGVIVMMNIDNMFRFILQKKLADVHPLITIFGVILGLKLFGFWGIIFGPLLLALFLLLLNIYRREYLFYAQKEREDI
ncbi:MAG: AI-2E family transporter [Bacteroidales bacterium]|jgi:predicted PurR-regulated permease PerM|nr:AI-2E family transporter [Bacteroidales bacterium]